MLSQHGVAVVEHDVVRQPPSEDELRRLLRGQPARELFSSRSRRARELGISPEGMTDEEIVGLLAREPGLLRRPIVELGDQVVIGLDAARLATLAMQTGGEAAATE